MLGLLEESRATLKKCQSTLDTLWRESHCNESVVVKMGLVKLAHQDLMRFYESEHNELEKLLTRVITGWLHCLTVYQKIYTMSARLPKLTKISEEELVRSFTSTPIDPSSALNVIEASNTSVLLYNDNETLFKYDSSALLDHSTEIGLVKSYYEKECGEVARLLAESSFIGEPSKMSQQQCQVRERFLRELRDLERYVGLELDLEKLVDTVTVIEKEWEQERNNAKPYVDILVAKFTESARLIDNLFRARDLTATRKRTTSVKSIF